MRYYSSKLTTSVVYCLSALIAIGLVNGDVSLRRKRRVLDVTTDKGEAYPLLSSKESLFWDTTRIKPKPADIIRRLQTNAQSNDQQPGGIESIWAALGTGGSGGSLSFSMPTPPSPTPVPPPQPSPPTASSGECEAQPTREDAFLFVLESVTPPELLQDPNTPQGVAFNWILSADEAQIDPCASPEVSTQRYALATFYYATEGDTWIDNNGWLSGSNECSWFGITCNSDSILVFLGLGEYYLSMIP